MCSVAFWNVFLKMHAYSIKAIDSALQAVKKTFVHGKKEQSEFPVSRRVLLQKMAAVPAFWPQVQHTYQVDLRHFNLPSGCKEVTFKFVDPLWGWVMAARRQHPKDMHWKPIAQKRGQKLYGGGVQYGECMREACRTIPAGAYPMLFGVHWDGTSAHGVSSSPICVCVGNTNICDKSAQYCIGYMPHVPDEKKPEWKKQPLATRVKFYIRQKCFTAILRILEEAATRGVKVRLKNQRGEEVARVLYPKLSSLNFDQPEAQLVFGLQNKTGCTKCRRRKGYSAFRSGTRQTRRDVQILYNCANDNTSPHQNMARKKLQHWGFNYRRECCLLQAHDHLFVEVGGRSEVFPCVDYRDRMHGLVIFLHRMLRETLDLVIPSAPSRRLLDRRLAAVGKRAFRVDGIAIKAQRSIFSEVGMSALDKLWVVFQLSHVFGPRDTEILPEAILQPLLNAIATAQLILLAVKGNRLYNKQELELIFDHGFVQFFASLESIREVHHQTLTREAVESSAPPPKRFKRQEKRYMITNSDLSMLTVIDQC
jgi:hypothetical protein